MVVTMQLVGIFNTIFRGRKNQLTGINTVSHQVSTLKKWGDVSNSSAKKGIIFGKV